MHTEQIIECFLNLYMVFAGIAMSVYFLSVCREEWRRWKEKRRERRRKRERIEEFHERLLLSPDRM